MPQNKYITKGLDEIYTTKVDRRTVDEVVEDVCRQSGITIKEVSG